MEMSPGRSRRKQSSASAVPIGRTESPTMPLREDLKKGAEALTGLGRPRQSGVDSLVRRVRPGTYSFADDGRTPNHPPWPMLGYRRALRLPSDLDPAAVLEVLFARHRWRDTWRDGMYPFNHFHTGTHECLGIARGWVRAQLGGTKGRRLTLEAGD